MPIIKKDDWADRVAEGDEDLLDPHAGKDVRWSPGKGWAEVEGMRLERGTLVLVTLNPTLGHEQRGTRPCIVVSDPDVTEDQRFPLLCVVPIAGTPGEGALYPRLMPGGSGLRKPSTALVDQVRSVDKRRIRKAFGSITPEGLDAIDRGLLLFLGLGSTGSIRVSVVSRDN